MGFIYMIYNKINDKKYIGQTTRTIGERYKEHLKEVRYNRLDLALYRAMRKYGVKNFDVKEIEECSNEELDEREIYWIDYYNTYGSDGYNETKGGNAPACNFSRKVVQLDKDTYEILNEFESIRQAQEHLGCRANISGVCRGKLFASCGYVWRYSEDIQDNYKIGDIAQTFKIKISQEYIPKIKVYQFDKDMNFIKAHESLSAAARFVGGHAGAIKKACDSPWKTCKGYYWRLANNVKDIFNEPKIEKIHHEAKPINQYDLNGNLINTFSSMTEAAKSINKDLSQLSIARKRDRPLGGYIWKFAEKKVSR